MHSWLLCACSSRLHHAAEGLRAHAPICTRSSRPHEAGPLVPLSWVGGPGSSLWSHSQRVAGRDCGLGRPTLEPKLPP